MKRKLIIISSILILSFNLKAQDYTTSLGLRLGGWENGITLKHFLGDGAAIEGILSTRWRGYNITGLYEIQNAIDDVDGLNWYIGGGAHIGHFDDRYHNGWGNSTGTTYTVIGVDGIIGLEYIFADAPINISLDWKPALNLTGYGNSSPFWGDNGAISVRYKF